MNVYYCSYWYYGRYQYIDERHEVVVAENGTVALGLILDKHTDLSKDLWTISPIDLTKAHVYDKDS